MMLAHSFRALQGICVSSGGGAAAAFCSEEHCKQAITDAMEIGEQREV
jgi:hypothetical protein